MQSLNNENKRQQCNFIIKFFFYRSVQRPGFAPLYYNIQNLQNFSKLKIIFRRLFIRTIQDNQVIVKYHFKILAFNYIA